MGRTVSGVERETGYEKHPEHKLAVSPAERTVRVVFQGKVLAESANALRLDEGTYPAVYYVPRADADMSRLERTAHTTYCPFKGDASYFSIKGEQATEENAVWTYEDPYVEVGPIKDHLAFYANKVEIALV